MELPKNITQIGETNHRCKIYVEDYVISYMKQLNHVALDKDMAVALYGVRKEEDDVSYLFLYGACKLTFLQKETRHLSQAQQQEIEKLRTKYFAEYTFLGYRLLNGEMIEGMHVCEQGICRYIPGYAQFYEKNDSMLAYMLDAREEVKPEEVNQQKYETVRKRQEERRQQYGEAKYPGPASAQDVAVPKASGVSTGLRGMRVAVVAVFALLCIIGLTSMNGEGKLDDLQAMARQVMEDVSEQSQTDIDNLTAENSNGGTLVAEDKLAEAIQQENEAAVQVQQVSTPGVVVTTEEEMAETVTPESAEVIASQTELPEETVNAENEAVPSGTEETVTSESAEVSVEVTATQEVVAADTPVQEDVAQEDVAQEDVAQEVAEPQQTSYIIKEGDTLIGISVANYGSDSRVSDICAMNQIDNPDDIKVGQKILLP